MIKLLHMYNFGDLKSSDDFDFTGIWQTVGVKQLSAESELWKLKRVASFTKSPVGEEIELPKIVLETFAKHIDRLALVGVPVST